MAEADMSEIADSACRLDNMFEMEQRNSYICQKERHEKTTMT